MGTGSNLLLIFPLKFHVHYWVFFPNEMVTWLGGRKETVHSQIHSGPWWKPTFFKHLFFLSLFLHTALKWMLGQGPPLFQDNICRILWVVFREGFHCARTRQNVLTVTVYIETTHPSSSLPLLHGFLQGLGLSHQLLHLGHVHGVQLASETCTSSHCQQTFNRLSFNVHGMQLASETTCTWYPVHRPKPS